MIFLSFLGAGIGIALGTGLTLWIEEIGIQFPGMDEVFRQWGISGRIYPDLSLISAIAGPGIIVVSIIILGVSAETVFRTYYYLPEWQQNFSVGNSFVL